MKLAAAWMGFALALTSPAVAQDGKPEIPKLKLAVGGKSAVFYLPLSVTERLDYFKDASLDLEIADVQSGARALQSVGGGSAELGVGTFDPATQMQAKNQPVVAVVQYGRYPGFVLGTIASKALNYHGPQDLKGLKIGVTSPGSSTHLYSPDGRFVPGAAETAHQVLKVFDASVAGATIDLSRTYSGTFVEKALAAN